MVGNMKTDKFNIDDIVFFKYGNGIVKSKIEYITYSKTGEVLYYSISGFLNSLFSENVLFSTLGELVGNESPKTQLF
jgi:hypothetical protein